MNAAFNNILAFLKLIKELIVAWDILVIILL